MRVTSRCSDDLSSADSDVSEVEEAAPKRQKSAEVGQSTETKLILGQLERNGTEINTNLVIVRD